MSAAEATQKIGACDVLIRNGVVIDGTGAQAMPCDVGIVGDRISAIGPRLSANTARLIIDAEGMVVSPGFIDMHAHSDIALLKDPRHEAKAFQGVTLEVIGQDGLSYAPSNHVVIAILQRQIRGWNGDLPADFSREGYSVPQYMSLFEGRSAVNVAYLAPHGTIRMLVLGMDSREPRSSELDAMGGLLRAALTDGAVGMSTGLTYAPAMFATNRELEYLCGILSDFGRFYCPHHRNYGSRALESFQECIDLAQRTRCSLHLAHTHMSFPENRDNAPELLERIDRAIERGVDITFDSYPYLAGATYLHALLPSWFQKGGPDEVTARLRDPDALAQARMELEEKGSDGLQGVPIVWRDLYIAGVGKEINRRFVGKNFVEISQLLGASPFACYIRILLDDDLGTSCIIFVGHEHNVRAIMRHRVHTVGSDAILIGDRPHPRGWGTFPRYLAKYVREDGVLSLEECVRHMTSSAAERLGVPGRGRVAKGFFADLVVFDPEAIRDHATYEAPKELPSGIRYVFVNGVMVIREGNHTGATPGRWVTPNRG